MVVLVARSPERLAATAEELTQAGAEPKMLELDLVADNAVVRLGEFLRDLPGMVSRGRGGVINLSSVAGFLPGPHMALYYASKSLVRLFSLALCQELRGSGVTVTCVAPGPVRTNFLGRAGARRAPLFRERRHKSLR